MVYQYHNLGVVKCQKQVKKSAVYKTDIDYDRLADTIVKAHERIVKTEAKEKESQEKAEHDEWFNWLCRVS